VGNFECPACYCISEEKYFLCTYGRVFKMSRSNDMCCKKWALTEFIVADNKSVTKLYRWLKCTMYQERKYKKMAELLGGNNERNNY
jgi:hypothetical protein